MEWTFKSDRSIYLQIIEQIKFNILSGKQKPGDKVGSVRELAKQAAVNPNTMQRALSELERQGFIYKERTKERFITQNIDLIDKTRTEFANKLLSNFFIQMNNIGYDLTEIKKLVKNKNQEENNG